MPFSISQPQVWMFFEKLIRRSTLQQLRCVCQTHAGLYVHNYVHMVWHDRQFFNLHVVFCSYLLQNRFHILFVPFFSENVKSIFWTPLYMIHALKNCVSSANQIVLHENASPARHKMARQRRAAQKTNYIEIDNRLASICILKDAGFPLAYAKP